MMKTRSTFRRCAFRPGGRFRNHLILAIRNAVGQLALGEDVARNVFVVGGVVAQPGDSVTLDSSANVERFSNWLNWLNLGFLGLLASAACFAMWNCVCNAIGVVRATVGLYLTPIVGVVFAVVFLDERLTPMSVFGGLCIVIGVAIANWRRKR